MPRRGENIYKRKDGRWEGRYIKGHSYGKTQYGYVYARTYAEVKSKLAERSIKNTISKLSAEHVINQRGHPTFEEISTEWLTSIESQIKESTYIKYANSLNSYLNPAFSSQAIEAISRSDVSSLCLELSAHGGINKEGLSSKTITDSLSILRSIFIYAADEKGLTDGGSKGKEREKRFLSKAKDSIRVISDAKGGFYIENDIEWMSFKWLTAPSSIRSAFVDKIEQSVKPVEIGTKYYKRYKMHLPDRSKDKRKTVSVPFAIDEDDNVISCSFENELFAAFMMGASRSGKSTLLHTIIGGLMMNYHPDELELWLLDFKMLEFKKYAVHRAPHIKYILLNYAEHMMI